MAAKWTHTREVLQRMQPSDAGKYLMRLFVKGPQVLSHARTLLRDYPLTDDRFKIHMIHYLRRTFPGDLEPLYEAMLQDIMADKPQLPS